jgi:hypothetical protein
MVELTIEFEAKHFGVNSDWLEKKVLNQKNRDIQTTEMDVALLKPSVLFHRLFEFYFVHALPIK